MFDPSCRTPQPSTEGTQRARWRSDGLSFKMVRLDSPSPVMGQSHSRLIEVQSEDANAYSRISPLGDSETHGPRRSEARRPFPWWPIIRPSIIWAIAPSFRIAHAEKVSADPAEEGEKSIGLPRMRYDISHVISPVTLSQRSRTLTPS